MTINDYIIGNEQAKRAVEIALKGNLKILFIGKGEAEAFVDYLTEQKYTLCKALQPCKCGFCGDRRISCSCSVEQIQKQRRVIDNVLRNWADMVVETQSPTKEQTSKWLGETYKDILESDSLSLVSLGYDRLNLTVQEIKKVIEVSKTIAELDNSEKVLVQHIAEALQYRYLTI